MPGDAQTVSRPIPRLTTPTASVATPIHRSVIQRLGVVRSWPISEKKKPEGIRIAESGTKLRASVFGSPLRPAASA